MKRKPTPSSKSSSTKSPASKPSRSASGARAKTAPAAKKTKPEPAKSPSPTSKKDQLIGLLRTASGASMADMMALTGWQSHTVRGMLSGSLRKRLNLDVQCQRVEGVHRYRIVEAAAA